ncbi:alcohol dehydrogenase catalytic domain-containing protein [Cyanobium sp. ULC084]
MKAIIPTPGVPLNVPRSLVEIDLPSPTPGDHDLVVRVAAISVNPVDTKVRAGLLPNAAPPWVLGWDAAGIVEAVGPATGRYRPGDAVIFAGDITRPGCNAELVAVDERLCGRHPGFPLLRRGSRPAAHQPHGLGKPVRPPRPRS